MFGPISWETMIRPSLNEPVTSPPDAVVASASVEVSPSLALPEPEPSSPHATRIKAATVHRTSWYVIGWGSTFGSTP